MNPLNLCDAFRLYDVLHEHIPSGHRDNMLDFIHEMVDNMIATDHGDDYVTAVAIMNQSDMETVAYTYENSSQDLLLAFIHGLEINQFMTLIEYVEGLNGR